LSWSIGPSATAKEVRPAVVVQADFFNVLIDDTVLVAITRTRRVPATEVLLDPTVEIGSGLTQVSIASCTNFLTVDQSLIFRKLGVLLNPTMQQIDQRLKTALNLP
jgi:mRNA-degrading endonuclease toxin of MazEF toxin-antitoxin module